MPFAGRQKILPTCHCAWYEHWPERKTPVPTYQPEVWRKEMLSKLESASFVNIHLHFHIRAGFCKQLRGNKYISASKITRGPGFFCQIREENEQKRRWQSFSRLFHSLQPLLGCLSDTLITSPQPCSEQRGICQVCLFWGKMHADSLWMMCRHAVLWGPTYQKGWWEKCLPEQTL